MCRLFEGFHKGGDLGERECDRREGVGWRGGCCEGEPREQVFWFEGVKRESHQISYHLMKLANEV